MDGQLASTTIPSPAGAIGSRTTFKLIVFELFSVVSSLRSHSGSASIVSALRRRVGAFRRIVMC
jgi:hypothetical protein